MAQAMNHVSFVQGFDACVGHAGASDIKKIADSIGNLDALEKWRQKDQPSEDLYLRVREQVRTRLGLTR